MKLYERLLEMLSSEKKTGLALGGGAVYGAAHIGVLKALEEHDIKIDCISGTSIGAFIGALYASGMKPDEIQDRLMDVKWLDISKFSISKFGLLSNKKFASLVNECIGDITFNECPMPLSIVAADITSGDKVILNDGSIAKAIMASTCIPGIFKPVSLDNRFLVDGGVVENVPISPLKSMGAEYIIAVDLNTGVSNKTPSNILEVMVNAFHFAMMSASRLNTSDADLFINPDLSNYNRFNTQQVKDLIKKGYEDANKVLNTEH